MNQIEKVVLKAILEQNGLSKEDFDINETFAYNGLEPIDLVETLMEIEDQLSIELNFDEVDVYWDSFSSLVKYVEDKL